MDDFRVHYKNISGSALIKGAHGRFYGFYVNSTSSGTIIIYDGLDNTGTVLHNTITPAIGLYQFPNGVEFDTGLYVAKTGGSIDLTFFYA